MKKLLKWSILAVALLIVAGLAIFWLTLNSVVRRTIETQATASLSTPTTLDAASVAPFRGKVELDDLKIANPEGFAPGHILSLGDVKLAVKYGQLRQDPIRVESITLEDPVITIDQKDLKTNIQALMDRLPKGEETPASGNERPIHLIIGNLTVANPTVVLRPGFPGLPQELKLTLPSLTLNDVGTGEGNRNGAAIKDVVMLVLTEVASRTADSDKLPPELRQLLSLDVKQLTARMKDELNIQVEKVSQRLTEQLGTELGSAVGGVLKDPKSASTNPAPLIEQGLGALLKDRTQPKSTDPQPPPQQPISKPNPRRATTRPIAR